MKVITYGSFDLFHYGHYNLLKRASELGDELIVGVSSDAFCVQKGKATILSQEKRMEIVSSLRFVDCVILEESMSQKTRDVERYGVSCFVLGDDYAEIFPKMKEYQELLDQNCQVVFLPRTPEISTTALKRKLFEQEKLDQNQDSVHHITKTDF